ncbi:hypothetical protein RDI58_005270 [Solanum bulbocastanum]|uniref:Uncharacterized protein n=1 Tax=Solanum bulbocastanum TaxID=147425 RepID=A0AAN8TZ29_SOLBU
MHYHWFPSDEVTYMSIVHRPNGSSRSPALLHATQSHVAILIDANFYILMKICRNSSQDLFYGYQKYLRFGENEYSQVPTTGWRIATRGPIDREAEAEVRIKQALLKVEENYRSTLNVLNNDLKNVKEELAQHETTLEARVRLVQ